MVRVKIVHPTRLVREGLAGALAHDPEIEVVGEAGSSGDLRSQPGAFDVAVVDLVLPERRGLEQAREINEAFPQAAIVMTGLGDIEADALAACEAGATGFLHQGGSLQELRDRVLAAARGETTCSPRMAALLSSRLRERVRDLQKLLTQGDAHLTRREIEIVHLIEQRLSNKEIAAKLDIEVQTVKNHVHNILDKLAMPGRHAAARYARERGILTRGPAFGLSPRP